MGLFDSIKTSDETVEVAPSPEPIVVAAVGHERMMAEDAPMVRAERLRDRNRDHRNSAMVSAGGEQPLEANRNGPDGIPPGDARLTTMTPRGVDLLQLSRNPPEFDTDHQALFLDALCETPAIERACWQAGVMLSQVKRLRDADPGFEEAVQMARAMAAGAVEAQAFRLALNGVVKGVYFQGVRCDEEVTFLPDLMRTVLAANDPKYKQKVEMSGSIGVNHNWADMVKAMKQDNEGSA